MSWTSVGVYYADVQEHTAGGGGVGGQQKVVGAAQQRSVITAPHAAPPELEEPSQVQTTHTHIPHIHT